MEYKLGELVEQVTETNTELNFGLNDIVGVTIDKKIIPTIANLKETDLKKFVIVSPNDFIYNPRTHGKKIGLGYNNADRKYIATWNNNTFRIKAEKRNTILSDYLYLYFNREIWDKEACFNSWGSSTVVFSWDSFCDMKINLPDIEEQKSIVREYQVIEKRINILEKLNTKLYEITQLNYQKLLSDYTVESDVLPANWNIATIGQYVDVKSGYAFKSDWWKKRGNKVIKIGNIVNNTIDCVNCDCVDKDKSDRAKDYQVKTGDLLIAMTGATTGKVGIVPKINEKLWVNQRVGKFYLGNNPFDKLPFLFCTINSRDVHRQTHPNGETGSAQDNLSPDDIKNIKIILPDECKVQEFNNKNKTMFENITNNNGEIIELCKIKEKILSKLL